MGKVCTKQILRLLWKMVENKFFLDSEHEGVTGELLFPLRGGKQVQVRGIPPPPKRTKEHPWKPYYQRYYSNMN